MSLSPRGSIIAALFPKEQVPASTPIPPREVGTIFLSLNRGYSWDEIESARRIVGSCCNPATPMLPQRGAHSLSGAAAITL
jgi:hypothetical protein